MKIIVLSTVYPSKNAPVGTTPVVHLFTREWVKMGHSVIVFHIETRYPFFIYWGTKLFEKQLNSKLGFLVSTKKPKPYVEILDGVKVFHIVINKFLRSPRFKMSEIEKVNKQIEDYCQSNGTPDLFIGHWPSPQLEILNYLKQKYPTVRNTLVFHSLNRDLNKSYPYGLKELCDKIDVIGFRNPFTREEFKRKYFDIKNTFIASSGISEMFVKCAQSKTYDKGIHSFIYVGSLIHRKHPTALIAALAEVYRNSSYKVSFIGDGKEESIIREQFRDHNKGGELELTGRIPRTQVINYLKESDVFVMISEHETFGLVYLEAMALGCITIASRGGGVDGIIRDGENGFLCNPGDVKDLSRVIEKIRRMDINALQTISVNAMNTAMEYTDAKVAESYLNAIMPTKIE